MARNLGTVLLNNFSRGLVTEATGLNFPDNAVTESDNVVFERVGRVSRRLGYDIEEYAETLGYGGDATSGILKEYLWQSVAKQGGFTFLVVQMGANIRFYEVGSGMSLSSGAIPLGIDLRDYKIPGSPDINTTPASFAAGAGYLFITHPSCNPILVEYDSDEDQFYQTHIKIYIRDFEGVEDGLAVDEQPEDLTPEHAYNLKNQSWYKDVRVGSVNNEPGGVNIPPNSGFWGLFGTTLMLIRDKNEQRQRELSEQLGEWGNS